MIEEIIQKATNDHIEANDARAALALKWVSIVAPDRTQRALVYDRINQITEVRS